MAIFELVYMTTAAIFIGLVVVGHVLLGSAVYRCLRDGLPIGKRVRLGSAAWTRRTRPRLRTSHIGSPAA